jgi:hypothetical protein
LVSADTGTITIFVSGTATDRNLDAMFNEPPTSAGAAIPTLARASEYANAVIGAGNQTAEIRIAPGLYDPASIWQCPVRFVAYNAGLTAPLWASNSAGTSTTPNNYFGGSGWDDFSAAVNFWTYRLVLRDASTSGNAFQVNLQPRTMRFSRSVDFQGGFHCLGLAEIIKAVGNGLLPRTSFLGGVTVMPALTDFTSTLSTNVDTLLSAMRTLNSRTETYDSWVAGSFILLQGGTTDTVHLRDLAIGPGLPSHKDSLGVLRPPLIAVEGLATLRLSNFYIRGKTTITSAGIGATSALPLANATPYGGAAVAAPWVWSQTHHTLIGATHGKYQLIQMAFGNEVRYNSDPATVAASTYYQDATGKLLPNHIHLLTNAGAAPTDATSGPFFEQFIHAPQGLSVGQAWQQIFESVPILPRLQGFVGKFGSNGHNTVKTRGVVGGSSTLGDYAETGFTFSLLLRPDAINGRSIFQRAGVAVGTATTTAKVTYDDQSQPFGTGFPAGATPLITTDTSGGADLNLGLRSFSRGISAEFAITIPASNVIL